MCNKVALQNIDKLLDDFSKTKQHSNTEEHNKIGIDNDDTHCEECNSQSLLNDKGIIVLPDILCNAGGVVVSYFEWTQNLYQRHWEEETVFSELSKVMKTAYKDVKKLVDNKHLNFRQAAFVIGVNRVVSATKLRGYV